MREHITVTITSEKSKWLAFILCLFLGWLGAHQFYVGKWIWGIIYLCTCGLFGVGIVVDLIRIIFGNFKDSQGVALRE